jgi:hypothetical protein
MKKATFPTYKDNWTRTPNVFFDEILANSNITLNQVRLIGYLIRNTLGYNREAKWTGVTRSKLIDEAGIPNGRITDTLNKSIENSWVLIYESGKTTKKERYIFLNDDLNARIVIGLRKKLFKVSNLEHLNLAGINALLDNHGITENTNIHTSTVSVENKCTSTETVEVAYTETVEVAYTETVEADRQPAQEPQGLAEPLNTSFKDNIKRQQQQEKNVVVVFDEFNKTFEKKITKKQAEDLIQLAIENEKDIFECIKETTLYYQQSGKEQKNPYGAVYHSITKGWDVAPVAATKVENDTARIDKGIHTWIALGRSPEEPAFLNWVEQGGSIDELKQLVG